MLVNADTYTNTNTNTYMYVHDAKITSGGKLPTTILNNIFVIIAVELVQYYILKKNFNYLVSSAEVSLRTINICTPKTSMTKQHVVLAGQGGAAYQAVTGLACAASLHWGRGHTCCTSRQVTLPLCASSLDNSGRICYLVLLLKEKKCRIIVNNDIA